MATHEIGARTTEVWTWDDPGAASTTAASASARGGRDWTWDLPHAPRSGESDAWPSDGRRPPVVGLIAAKNPVSALVVTVESLFAGGASRVIVVDDGSDSPASLEVFDQAEKHGAEVIHLPVNMGKSNALREGFLSLKLDYGDQRFLIAQVDDDTYAGDLAIPVKMITDGKADIVDIRVETFDGTNVISNLQQLDYWLINATTKRFQDWARARLWLSGASLLYTSEAAEVVIMMESVTQTEDTEGRFRAIQAGLKVRFCSSRKAQFKTMVPESVPALRHQWKRWALGNAQIIRLFGLGAGSVRIAAVHLLSWCLMLIAPVLQLFVHDWVHMPWASFVPEQDRLLYEVAYVGPLLSFALWMTIFGIAVGIIGAIQLRRPQLVLVGVLIPLMSVYWTYHAIEGLVRGVKYPRALSMTWTPPKRMEAQELADFAAVSN